MKRRIISFLLAALLLPVFCVQVFAHSGVGEGDGIAWVVDDAGALIVSGEGAMENHSPAGAGWGSWIAKNITAKTGWDVRENDITSVRVKGGVTDIGNAAFAHCRNNKEAVLEDGVVTIGSHAFLENSTMTQVAIPATVTEIGYMAFYNCGDLADVYYDGTEAMWKEVFVDQKNEDLLNARFHFREEPKPARKLGDVNNDGEVNYEDALLALRNSIGLEELDQESWDAANVNGDDTVNYEDALKILRSSIGLEELA